MGRTAGCTSGFVGLRAFAGVGGFCEVVVAGFWVWATKTRVLTFETTGPAVMAVGGTGSVRWCFAG